MTNSTWSPISWRAKPAAQQATYPDAAELERVLGEMAALPPLVTVGTSFEVRLLLRFLVT